MTQKWHNNHVSVDNGRVNGPPVPHAGYRANGWESGDLAPRRVSHPKLCQACDFRYYFEQQTIVVASPSELLAPSELDPAGGAGSPL